MSIMDRLAALHRLDEEGWARHANPWSVWTRIPILPAVTLVLWFAPAMGWWTLLPLGLIAFWTAINPRAFGPPESTRSWPARGVMGERVWLARAERPIPPHHERMAQLLVWVAAAGLLFLVWGLWTHAGGLTLFGLALAFGGKMWFIDRMVWLYDDMAREDPIYAAWMR
ncbi:DUF6653 family protein [Oceanomicrobium pacificus]|uniref:Uncharacterized protein n=1 Tax=Oceanomicrobium pacificus TaxID=2692916 RepID=A0A6B0TRY5_9RHOB|nr:DUF6653 family protein [Oceanomicrobium pacificus]MXU65479.1 hypothetical protein [Oceanomicrobium pacificus]